MIRHFAFVKNVIASANPVLKIFWSNILQIRGFNL